MATSTTTKARTDSTDRTPALPVAKGAPAHSTKSPATRFSVAARRLLNTLMRSLASPHV